MPSAIERGGVIRPELNDTVEVLDGLLILGEMGVGMPSGLGEPQRYWD